MTPRTLVQASASAACLALLASGCSGGDTAAGSFYDPGTDDQALTQVCGASSGGPVQGYDVSVYQGNFNWPAVQFGAARVSDGTGYIDPKFDANWASMKAKGIVRSAYQFFEPGEDETAQAKLVIEKVGRLGAGDLPVMLDIEVTGGQSPATIRARAQHWLDLVEAGTGKKPFVYSYASFLQTNLGSGFGSYPLWIANYGASCPSVPAGWSNWVFWQYSDGSGKLDHDVFNGTEAQLKSLAGDVTQGPPTATPSKPSSSCGGLEPGTGIVQGEGITSCDGRFTLTMQGDGNLVLYLDGSSPALWSTHTSTGYAAIMQGDGNFVLYDRNSTPVFHTDTNGHAGATLALQGDGNLVVYNAGKALWDTGTEVMGAPGKPSGCGTINPGEGLTAGDTFSSCSGAYTLAMQGDGNLVLYHNGKGALWSTVTAGSIGYAAIMQTDGNFVLYDRHAKPLWNSKTAGHAGSHLSVQGDGNLVVYSGSTATWASHTAGK